MVIKYDTNENYKIMYVPDNTHLEFGFKRQDNDLMDNGYSLYLIFGEKEFLVRDSDYWCKERKLLPAIAVRELYEEIVETIRERLVMNPNLDFLDIDEIESELIESKYKEKWLKNGCIEINADGNW